jgi:cobalt-zinc-cadmium efflux system membrane fusion protein
MRSTLLFLLVLAFSSGCQQRGDAAKESQPTGAAAPAAEVADEALCARHGVLEAVCTKCNPKLIPVFQAKGDWCAEHEFPESFCPVCHPERGGKPAVDVAVDEAPADGLRIKFKTKEVAAQVGIETAPAVPSDAAASIVATATIVADASKSALVNVRSSGIIRAFKVDLGARVSKGGALAIIESANVAQDRAHVQSARARVESREANYEREKSLHERGISALKEVQAAKQELEEARAELAAAEAAVQMVAGVDGSAGTYALLAPISGVVTARNLTVGTVVDREETIFEIVDTSSLWAEIDIPESQANQVSTGDPVVLEVDGIPGREFAGKLQYVAPQVDPRTRTVKARAALDNRDGALRANTYARARITPRSGGSAVLVPRAALQDAKGAQLVFVPLAVDEYETRRVRAIPAGSEWVAVTSGLMAGESVVTTGSFLLKTETLKGSIGAGCCEVEAPK